MNHSDEQFLKQIEQNPDAPEPILHYRNWLIEQGRYVPASTVSTEIRKFYKLLKQVIETPSTKFQSCERKISQGPLDSAHKCKSIIIAGIDYDHEIIGGRYGRYDMNNWQLLDAEKNLQIHNHGVRKYINKERKHFVSTLFAYGNIKNRFITEIEASPPHDPSLLKFIEDLKEENITVFALLKLAQQDIRSWLKKINQFNI